MMQCRADIMKLKLTDMAPNKLPPNPLLSLLHLRQSVAATAENVNLSPISGANASF